MKRAFYFFVFLVSTSFSSYCDNLHIDETLFLSPVTCIPFTAYEDWLQDVKHRYPEGEAEQFFKRTLSRDTFIKYKKLVQCLRFKYKSDGLNIDAFLSVPTSADSQSRYPLVIYNRGGNASFGEIERIGLYNNIFPLTEKGVVVLASNYRGSTRSDGNDEFGGKDVNDVVALLEIAKTLPFVDSQNINLWGWSRGAMMAMLAARSRKDIHSIVFTAGSVDLFELLKFRPEMEKVFRLRIPNYQSTKQDSLKERSPIFWLDKIDSAVPILVIHGDIDKSVSVKQAYMLDEALTLKKHPHRTVIFDKGSHGLWFHRTKVLDEVYSWITQG